MAEADLFERPLSSFGELQSVLGFGKCEEAIREEREPGRQTTSRSQKRKPNASRNRSQDVKGKGNASGIQQKTCRKTQRQDPREPLTSDL